MIKNKYKIFRKAQRAAVWPPLPRTMLDPSPFRQRMYGQGSPATYDRQPLCEMRGVWPVLFEAPTRRSQRGVFCAASLAPPHLSTTIRCEAGNFWIVWCSDL